MAEHKEKVDHHVYICTDRPSEVESLGLVLSDPIGRI